jgi:ribosomal protein S19
MVNQTVRIHNGRDFKDIKITVDHVNHRLGEFFHSKVTPRFKTKIRK